LPRPMRSLNSLPSGSFVHARFPWASWALPLLATELVHEQKKLPDSHATTLGLQERSRSLVHYRHRMETRNCVERIQDDDITKRIVCRGYRT
jgi:hypothetical protein